MNNNNKSFSAGKQPALKIFWFCIGMIFCSIGMIGIIVPGLPTTIFMILAAGCFFRSSKKMYLWVINHRMFGAAVLRFRTGQGMPKKAKYYSIMTMWTFIIFALFFGISESREWIKGLIIFSAFIGTFYIIRQPNLKT